jgi:hypothetical protein
MKSLQIVNGDGKQVAILLDETEISSLKVAKLTEDVYCLTCGDIPLNPENLNVMEVGITEGLKSWLAERSHFAQKDDHVLLCGDCRVEGRF